MNWFRKKKKQFLTSKSEMNTSKMVETSNNDLSRNSTNSFEELVAGLSISEMLAVRDHAFIEMTKQAIAPYAIELERFILYGLSEEHSTKITIVDKMPIDGYIRIEGYVSKNGDLEGTYKYVIPLHLLDAIKINQIGFESVSKFVNDFHDFCKLCDNEEKIIEVAHEFVTTNAFDLTLLDSYRKILTKLNPEKHNSEFDLSELTEQQKLNYKISTMIDATVKH